MPRRFAALILMLAMPAVPAAPVEMRQVVAASPEINGLEPQRGQRRIRLAPLADGRVIALYTLGYPSGCGLLSRCEKQSQVWHLVFDQHGLVVAPRHSTPELDARTDINSNSAASSSGAPYPDGRSAVFATDHASHNSNGGHFIRIDRDGKVTDRGGGRGAYGTQVCLVGEDLVVSAFWVDPISNGYLWYDKAKSLKAVVNLGGYGDNYYGLQELACGTSPALNGQAAILVRKRDTAWVGLSLYRVQGPRWSMAGQEVILPASGLPLARSMVGGGIKFGDDQGVVMFRDSSVEGRLNMFYARFRLTARGLELLDRRPRPLPVSPQYEGLDGSVVYGGKGRFYMALHQGGDSATGQPRNRRQAVRIYALDFASGQLQQIATPYEDANWSQQQPLGYYAMPVNTEAFDMVLSCDGNLYVGGAIDGGKGPSVLKIFSVPVAPPSCARSQRLRSSPPA